MAQRASVTDIPSLDRLLNSHAPNDDLLLAELRQRIQQAQEGMKETVGEVEA